MILGGLAVALTVGGAAAWLLAPRGLPTGADEASFCSSVNQAMTADNDLAVRNATQSINDDGVPAGLEGTTARPGVDVFLEMTESVGAAGFDYWSDLAVADKRTGQDRADLAAFLYYAYVTCEAPRPPSSS